MLLSTRNACKVVCLLSLALPSAFVVPVAAHQSSPPSASYDPTVATGWLELQLKLVRETPGFSPPVAARAFAYTGVTLYGAVVPGMPEHRSLVGQLNALKALPQPRAGEGYHWPSVANSALAAITRKLFATASEDNLMAVDELEQQFSRIFGADLDAATLERSTSHGGALAEAVYEWSRSDGGHEGYLRNVHDDYLAPVGPGNWLPTPRPQGEPLGALQPTWGNNRPFVLTSGAECPADPPPAYAEETGSVFYQQALEVYQTVRSLTPPQREIALYWADNPGETATPPGHWLSILTGIIKQQGYSLDTAAEAYATLGVALADSFIACWHTKYHYNLLRPISYIQRVIDPSWNAAGITDPVVTPPFPEYTSGHSVQSGAAAYVLTELLGEVAFTDHSHDALGFAPRHYRSFYEAAEEAAISRLYGGIHYRAAIEQGQRQGRCIGERVSALMLRKPRGA